GRQRDGCSPSGSTDHRRSVPPRVHRDNARPYARRDLPRWSPLMIRRLLLGLPLALVAACGGADRPPAEAPSQEPRTVEEAQGQIAHAKAELEGQTSQPAREEALPKDEPRLPPEATADALPGSGTAACISPCRALASMRRAVDALCRMTGDADARCTE